MTISYKGPFTVSRGLHPLEAAKALAQNGLVATEKRSGAKQFTIKLADLQPSTRKKEGLAFGNLPTPEREGAIERNVLRRWLQLIVQGVGQTSGSLIVSWSGRKLTRGAGESNPNLWHASLGKRRIVNVGKPKHRCRGSVCFPLLQNSFWMPMFL